MLLKKNIPFKYIFGKIKYEVIGVAIYATVIAMVYKYYNLESLNIPLSVPGVMITVVSLLLAFKSNQAYDRWWEARILWGAIVNDSRSFARQISNFIQEKIPGDEVYFFKQSFIKRQIAWCYSLNFSLRNQDSLTGIEKFLSRTDLIQVKNYNNTSMGLLQLHAQQLNESYKKGWINTYQQVEIDQTLTRLSNHMGGCERIKKTTFPVTYSVYIHTALMFIFLLMPFALHDIFGIVMVPMVVALAAVFFLIEKMAIHLQDPFENKPTDTPMTSICFTIERDLRQIINDTHNIEPTVNVTWSKHPEKAYYIL